MTDTIRIDSELYAQLVFKGVHVPLPQWFRHKRDLSRKNMLENVPAYLQSQKELCSSEFEELHKHKYFKKDNLFSKYYTVRIIT